MADKQFTVRKAAAGLREAYRVFLDAGALTKLGLTTGALCEIHQDEVVGIGIAWRGSDSSNSPKNPPVQMSETMRETFNFQLGKNVKIQKSTQKTAQAAKIELVDVTPSEYEIDSGSWQHRCRTALFDDNCEAVAVGMTFDVAAKKGLRKRYFVEHIESHGSAPQSGPALYTVGDSTEMVFTQGTTTRNTEVPGQLSICLDAAQIGGLHAQIQDLNRRLYNICEQAKHANAEVDFARNAAVLVHGYEGTGKTLLLNKVAAAFGSQRTFRINPLQLLGTTAKNADTINAVFEKAKLERPSVILMDDLHEVAGAGDPLLKPVALALKSAIEGVYGTTVLVIAAAPSMSSLHNGLIAKQCFSKMYELPIPDATARLQILHLELGACFAGNIISTVAACTHGFTGKDLGMLAQAAKNAALVRAPDETWVTVDVRPSPQSEDTATTLVDGTAHSRVVSNDEQQTSALSSPTVTMADFDVGLTEVRPTALREIILEAPNVTWNDIGGSDAMKEIFDETIGWPLHHMDKLIRVGREHWQQSVLLYGPPGCSKTMTAQAVANTYGLNFLAVKGAELISMYVGESERAVREIFRKAKAAKPCIIFFDEIDAIGSDRDAGGNSGLHVLTTLLNEMDGFEALTGVQIMAATNKPHTLDPALLRPGRFDQHVYLSPPGEAARRDIVALQLKKVQNGENLDVAGLAKRMDGYSGAEIVQICDVAVGAVLRRTIKQGGDERIFMEDFNAAIGATSRGITTEMLEVYKDFRSRGKRM
ncbi:AAA+-type ATPase [Oleoguttula sp. CCFEE 5521]